ncbi:hypothetical protein [Hymenobacter saemangeumensis]
MQDASQKELVEKVPARKKKQRRGPDEGNILWKLYTALGSVRVNEFREMLKSHGINPLTFNSQTARTYKVSRMRAGYLQLYRDFFLESGVDLNDIVAAELAEVAQPAPATASQQFDKNEQEG